MNMLGKSYPIHDAHAKVTGRASYVADLKQQGMLHMAVLFSPLPHAWVKKIDDSAARAMPGVWQVLHHYNTPAQAYNRYRSRKWQQSLLDQEQLFSPQVRFVGDRVAAVVADTLAQAKAALAEIQVEYEVLPFTTDFQQAAQGGCRQPHQAETVYGDYEVDYGTPDPATPGIETVTTSYLSRVSHLALEPHACVAAYDQDMEELTIWSPNQSVYGIQTVVGDLLGLPYHQVRVIKTTMGGSFGGKQEWILEPLAAYAALQTKRPVKLVYSRAETMRSTISRAPLLGRVISKITAEGILQAFDLDVTLDAGAYLGNSSSYVSTLPTKLFRCYRYPYAHYKGRAICTNNPVSGAYRGWTAPECYLLLEHNLNMAARKLKLDPVELRLKNAAVSEDIDLSSGVPLLDIHLKECLELGGEAFAWQRKNSEVASYNKQGKRYRQGLGVACGGHVNGYYPRAQDFAGMSMRMTESGSVLVNATLHDHGCGSVRAIQMLVAETLALPLDMVRVREGDTAYSPFDVGCYSSRTVYVLGRAAVDCAQQLQQRLLTDFAQAKGLDAGRLTYRQGRIYFAERGQSWTCGEAVVEILQTIQKEVWVQHQSVCTSNPGVTGAHFARVQVDTMTGQVKILDYLAVHDVGKIINREICVAQVQGAVLMGCGAALLENMDSDPATGRSPNSLKNYHLLNCPEAPAVQVLFVESTGGGGPFGAKSIGEVAHVPVAPCIVGAVNHALQSDLCHLPLTPDKILAALERRGEACNSNLR